MKLNTKSLAEVELGMPVVADGIYHARMESPEVKPNKTGTGNNLVVKFRLLDPTLILHKDGKEIPNKGQVCINRYFSLVPTESYDPDQAVKELAVAVGHDMAQDFQVEQIKDAIVMVKIVYKPAEGAYQEGNDIRRITPVPAEDTFTAGPI